MEHVKLELGAVTRVVLNRPALRNAMSDQTLREISEAFGAIAQTETVRVAVVTGEGQDFCSGADIQWMKKSGQLPGEEAKRDARLLAEALQAVDECPVPVVVAAQGNVFGGGLGLLAAGDIILLAEGAKLSFSEGRLGLVPAVISRWVLPKIGEANARRYYLTAELFGAREALAMGLVHEVVSSSELRAKAEALAGDVLKCGPRAAREAKALIAKLGPLTPQARVDLSVETLVRLRSSPEGQEGLSAFLDRRTPKWTIKA